MGIFKKKTIVYLNPQFFLQNQSRTMFPTVLENGSTRVEEAERWVYIKESTSFFCACMRTPEKVQVCLVVTV